MQCVRPPNNPRRRTGTVPVDPIAQPARHESRTMHSHIPTLDISRFSESASEADRAAFVAELGAAYREWGFAGIRGHGIAQSLIDDAYAVFAEFFALPEST